MASSVQTLPAMLKSIEEGEYIDSDQMDKFVKLLESSTGVSTFSVNAIQTLDGTHEMKPVTEPHIQIMFSGNQESEAAVGHYKVLHYNGREINIYDSLNTNIVTPLEVKFIDTVLPHVDSPPNFIRVQEQTNYIDCGVFAIANATSLALGYNPANQTYRVADMRPHLIHMLHNAILLPFPTVLSQVLVNDLESNLINFPNLPPPSTGKFYQPGPGRPKKTKRGRPKSSDLTLKQQHNEAAKRYNLRNPQVHQRAVSRYIQTHPEINQETSKRYSQAHPEVHNQAAKRYRQAHPEVHNQAAKRYRQAHPDVHKQATKRYSQANPNVHRKAAKRYAQLHPKINQESVKKYSKDNPQVHVEASKRYRETHSQEVREAKRTPVEVRRKVHVGEYSGDLLDTVKLFSLKKSSLISGLNYSCPFCHAKLFFEEVGRKRWCCCEGAYIVPTLPELGSDVYSSSHFLKNSRAFNNLFAFSALGVSHGFQHPPQGISFVKIQGRTYHRVFDLAYTDSTNPCGMYINDGEERMLLANQRKLQNNVVTSINEYLLEVNPFIHLLRKLSEEPSDEAHLIFESTARRTHGPILGDVPRSSEIAAIISTEREQFNPRQIVIWKVGDKKPHTVDVFHPLYESLQYPLLYPHGTPGWHIGITDNEGKKLSQVKYYRRLLLSEPRFSQLGRLSEEWLVDMYCRTEEERLRFIFNMQKKNMSGGLRTAPLNELLNNIPLSERQEDMRALAVDETIQGEGGIVPGRIYLPNTFTNSQRYMKTKYMDGMSIVARLGRPSYFLTVTCNPKWPEIVESTPPGTKASAVLVCRVFRLKLLELLRDIRSGKFFGKKIYLLYVIEFQKRGLPHSHICFRVDGGGARQNVEIDKVVRADIPSVEEANGRLKQAVLNHMIHGPCGTEHRTDLPCWDTKIAKCSKYFPKPNTEVTHVDEHGFVHYRRDSSNTAEIVYRNKPISVNDTWVVPYNAALLLKYDCHLNLEIASTRKIVKYLFKYITKGPDEARVALVDDSDMRNEVELYATKRYIGACDAAWRMLEFEITGREPNVIQLPVHLEGQQSVLFRHGQEAEAVNSSSSKLMLYFNRPQVVELDQLTYLDFYEQYLIHTKRPVSSNVAVLPHPDGIHYVTKRQRGEMVARLFWVAPNRGELFYLRLLLHNYPCKSYADLKYLGGEGCETFQSAARQMGLVNDELEYESALEEAHRFMIGGRLRRFFVLLIVAGARASDLWNRFKAVLVEDLMERCSGDVDKASKIALIQIERGLRRHGSTLTDHGLPHVEDDTTELGREMLRYSESALSTYVDEWSPRLSVDQRRLLDHVHGLANTETGKKAIFLDGAAGSGKTLILNVLVASLRAKGHVVLCVATSGIAAQNYDGGMTAHSMFRLPLDVENDNMVWGLSGGSQRSELIKKAVLIIFDEAPMAHKTLIHILDRSLRDLMNCSTPFGGKLVILAGDFRQIPPVVPKARSTNDVVSASIRMSPLWSKLDKFYLTTPQRTRDDGSYTEFLSHIGNGSVPSVSILEGKHVKDLIPLKGVNYTTEPSTLFDYLFSATLLSDPDACSKRALLCVTNVDVDSVNTSILNQLPGEAVHLLSVNYVEDANADDFFLGPDTLANIHAKGVPDHDLILKRNSVCMLVRNLHFDDGLLNGTKVIIVDISPRLVTVRKPGSMVLYSIPRITFQAQVEPGSPLSFYRRQFPLKLCYAMTINKAQGQTIDLVGVDLRSDVFSHGQLYVALGRVRSSENIMVLIRPERVVEGVAHVINIVCPQLL